MIIWIFIYEAVSVLPSVLSNKTFSSNKWVKSVRALFDTFDFVFQVPPAIPHPRLRTPHSPESLP